MYLLHISIHALFLLLHLNFIYTNNLSCLSFVTYLYVYVYDNISRDNNSSFQRHQIQARVWEWRGIGTDCPVVVLILKSCH